MKYLINSLQQTSLKVRSRSRKRVRRWKLFHATDFQSLMYPNLTLSNIIGIFPYRIKTSSFETSKPRYILWTIILCAICVYGLILIYHLNLDLSSRLELDKPTIISHNFTLLYGIFMTVISYILTGPRIRLLQTISDISSKLPQQSYRKLSKLIHAKDIFGFFFVLWVGIIRVYSANFNNIFDIPYGPFRIYFALLAFQMDMLYMNCVCILKACFKEINDNLENLRELVINNMPKWICHKQRCPFLLMKLKIVRREHLMISNTVQTLNVIFNLQLLATIALCFKQIIFFTYFKMVQWKNGVFINLHMMYDGYFLSLVLYYLIKVTLIVWACETGKNQATKIGTTIHDVLNSTNNVQIKKELHLFSLQIFHCKNTFSVKGLTVDATLLTVMANGITTYLLILIQFLLISHSCDKKKTTIHYLYVNAI